MIPRTFRLDVGSRSEQEVESKIKEWFEKNSDVIRKYVIAYEIAEKTKKPHYQGIMYVDEKVKFENCTRYWNKWKPHEKSFAIVRDEKTYRMYIKKDGDIRFTKGVTEEDMDSWGEWVKQPTQKEQKESRRQQMYAAFLEHCKEHDGFDTGYMDLRWIAHRLLDFMGTQPLPEQVNWFKGMIFSAQAVFLRRNHNLTNKWIKAKDEWIERVLY